VIVSVRHYVRICAVIFFGWNLFTNMPFKDRVPTFNDELQNEYLFLEKVCRQDDRVKCSCGSEFSVAHGGRADIKNHLKSSRHKNNLLVSVGFSKLTSYFKSSDPHNKELAWRPKRQLSFIIL